MAWTALSSPPLVSAQFDGFEQQQATNTARRAATREALMKILNEDAAVGKTTSFEDFMAQSRQLLGAQEFLNSGTPSIDAVQAMLSSQKLKAEQKAEELRRVDFTTKEAERKTITQAAEDRFANGDDPITVHQQLSEIYGADHVKNIDFKLTQSKAENAAVTRGIQYGSTMLSDTEDFETHKQNNPYLPKFELVGMQKAAQANEQKRTQQVAVEATNIGSTGPITKEAVEVELRAKVLPLFGPNAKTEKVEKAVQEGVKIALAASQRQSIAAQQKIEQTAKQQMMQDYPRDRQAVLALQEAEEQRKQTAAATRSTQAKSAPAAQLAVVEDVFKGKKNLSSEDLAVKSELLSTMSSVVFTGGDAALYTDAVMRKDTAAIAKIKGRAIPMEQFNEQVDSVSRIITGAHKFANISEAGAAFGRLGMSSLAIAKIGQQIAQQDAVYLNAPSVSTSRYNGAPPTLKDVFPWANGGRNPSPVQSSNEVSQTALLTSESLMKGFKTNVSDFLVDMTDAISANGSISATQLELSELARVTARERVKALVGGMALDKDIADEAVDAITESIINMTPAPAPITKKVSRAEQYEADMNKRWETFNTSGGGTPGVTQRYPPAGQGAWAPAHF